MISTRTALRTPIGHGHTLGPGPEGQLPHRTSDEADRAGQAGFGDIGTVRRMAGPGGGRRALRVSQKGGGRKVPGGHRRGVRQARRGRSTGGSEGEDTAGRETRILGEAGVRRLREDGDLRQGQVGAGEVRTERPQGHRADERHRLDDPTPLSRGRPSGTP